MHSSKDDQPEVLYIGFEGGDLDSLVVERGSTHHIPLFRRWMDERIGQVFPTYDIANKAKDTGIGTRYAGLSLLALCDWYRAPSGSDAPKPQS